MAQAHSVHHLTDGWSFKQADDVEDNTWLPVKRVPTNIHLDLIDNGKYVITWGGIWNYPRRMTDRSTRIEYLIPF